MSTPDRSSERDLADRWRTVQHLNRGIEVRRHNKLDRAAGLQRPASVFAVARKHDLPSAAAERDSLHCLRLDLQHALRLELHELALHRLGTGHHHRNKIG